jgi:hypothetical protein
LKRSVSSSTDKLERRTSSSLHTLRRQGHNLSSILKHCHLPDKWVARSCQLPNKEKKRWLILIVHWAVESYGCSTVEETIKECRKQRGPHLSTRSSHQSTKSHPIQLPTLNVMWGPPAPIPTSQQPQSGLTHSGARRSTRKV